MSTMIDTLATSVATRRGSLALGSAALLGLTQVRNAGARKKSCKKKVRQKIDETCGRQFAPCVTASSPFCVRTPDPEACEESVRECCEFMGQCDIDGYLACFAALTSAIDPA